MTIALVLSFLDMMACATRNDVHEVNSKHELGKLNDIKNGSHCHEHVIILAT